jgi:hypothetical protein
MTTYTDEQMVDDLAQQLFVSLTQDAPISPTVDFSDDKFNYEPDKTSALYSDVDEISIDELTVVELDGTGVFDKLMSAVDLHIQREFKGNRITGDQYAKVYIEVMSGVLGNAVQFILAKDQAYWASITAQMQARIAEIEATKALIELEEAKVTTQKAIFDMKNSGAQYAMTKLQLASENQKNFLLMAQTDGEVYRVKYLLPAELAIQEYQRMEVLPSSVNINKVQSTRVLPAEAAIKEFINRELQPIEKLTANYNINTTLPLKTDIDEFQRDSLLPVQLGQEQHKLNQQLPAQTGLIKEQWESQRAQTLNTRTDGLTAIAGLLGKQKDSITADIETKQFNIDYVLPIQLDLVKEQREGERSKTLDTRTDGITVVGSVGKQKDLYTQQISSFIADAKFKTAKMYLDNWITQKTLDEGISPPTELSTANAGTVLATHRATVGI